jgi:hypothetical protein
VGGHERVGASSPFSGVEDTLRVGLPLELGPQSAPGRLGRRSPVGSASPPLGGGDAGNQGTVAGTAVVIA